MVESSGWLKAESFPSGGSRREVNSPNPYCFPLSFSYFATSDSPSKTHPPYLNHMKRFLLSVLLLIPLYVPATPVENPPASAPSFVCAVSITGFDTYCVDGFTRLTANVTGNVGPLITYQWRRNGSNISPGGTNSTYDVTTAGTYSVVVAGVSCTPSVTSANFIVSQSTLAAQAITGGNEFCAGISTTLTANSSGGTVPYSYQWKLNGGNVGFNATTHVPNAAGNYTVEITDNRGCKVASPAKAVTQNASPTATIAAGPSDVICAGGNVDLTATASGGAGGYSYQWKRGAINVSTANPFNDITTAGSYTVVAKDSKGCEGTSAATVLSNSTLAVQAITGNAEFCAGSSTQLTANFSGGVGPYTYEWFLGATKLSTTASIHNANTAGSYTVTVSDSKGCSLTSAARVVSQNPLPSANAGPGATRTGNETYSLAGVTTGSGGTGALTYAWSTNPIVAGNGSTAAQPTFGPFSQNTTISLTVTDAKGCSASSSAAVNYAACSVTASVTANPSSAVINCQPGQSTITLSATPGGGTPAYTFAWRLSGSTVGTGATYNATAAGSYTVIVSDTKGCSVTSAPLVVTTNNLSTGTITGSGEFCAGSFSRLSASPSGGSGAFTYSWRRDGNPVGSGATYDANAPGAYTLVVTDSKGCTATSATKTVVQNPVPVANAGPGATRSGTETYSLAGVTTGSGGTGALTYAWSTSPIVAGNGSTASNPTFGPFFQNTTISLTVTDSKGCTAFSQATVTFQPCTLTVAVAPTPTDVLCTPGASTTLIATPANGTPPYSYQWRSGGSNLTGQINGNLSVSTAGAYSVVVTDAKGCVVTSSTINVTQSTLAVNSISGPTEFCAGTSFLLTANRTGGVEPFSYEWKRGADVVSTNATLSTNTGGSYTVKITDSKGCSATSPARVVTENPLPSANAGPDVTKVCDENHTIPGTVASGGTPGYTYAWNTSPGVNGNGSTASNPTFGTFSQTTTLTLTVRDSKGCTSTDNATVTKGENPLNVSISSPFTTICPDKSITFNSSVSGNQGANYQWQNNNNNIGGATNNTYNTGSAGNYRLVVRDDRGCQRESNTIGLNNSDLRADIFSSTAFQYCENGKANFAKLNAVAAGGTGNYSYRWKGGNIEGQTTPVVDVFAGFFNVTVTDGQGCTAFRGDVEVKALPRPRADAGPGIVLTGSEVYDLSKVSGFTPGSSGTGAYTFEWTAAPDTALKSKAEKPVLGPFTRRNVITLLVRDSKGCVSDPDTATVTYLPCNLTSVIAGNDYLCNASSTLLRANAANGWGDVKLYKHDWKRGTNPVAGTGDSLRVRQGGGYTLTTTDTRGCFKVSTLQVNELPPLQLSITGTSEFCRGSNATLQAAVTNGLPKYTFQWKNGSTVLNSDSARLVVPSGGEFTVSVTDSRGCGAASQAYSVVEKGIDISSLITVNGPTSVFAPNTVTLTGNTGTDYTYQWRKDGKDIAGATTITYTVTAAKDPGTANYALVVSRGGCQVTSPPFQVSVIVPTAVAPLTRGEFSVKAFPSPTTGRMQVDVSLEKAQALTLELTDLSGRSLFTRQSPTVDTQHRAEFDLTGRTAGIYLLRVQAGTQQAVQKVLKVD